MPFCLLLSKVCEGIQIKHRLVWGHGKNTMEGTESARVTCLHLPRQHTREAASIRSNTILLTAAGDRPVLSLLLYLKFWGYMRVSSPSILQVLSDFPVPFSSPFSFLLLYTLCFNSTEYSWWLNSTIRTGNVSFQWLSQNSNWSTSPNPPVPGVQ